MNATDQGLANGRSDELFTPIAQISADGGVLFFVTNALNIISKSIADPAFPQAPEGYLSFLDLATGEAQPLPFTRAGSDKRGDYLFPYLPYIDVSESGRYVLFTVENPIDEDNLLVEGGSYRFDTQTQELTPVAIAPDGQRISERNSRAVFLGGPNRVVFEADEQLYLRDIPAGTTTSLGPGNLLFGGKVTSGDGTKLLFEANLSPDENPRDGGQLYLRDFAASTVLRISSRPNGSPAFLGANGYSLSNDGGSVAFISGDDELDPRQKGSGFNVYFYDIATRTTELIQPSTPGPTRLSVSLVPPAMSDEGKFVIYVTEEYRLPRTGSDDQMEFFTLHDRTTGKKTVLTDFIQNPNVELQNFSDNPTGLSLTSDDRFVTFIARRSGELAYETLYLFDILTNQLRDIGTELGLYQASNIRDFALSSDGYTVLFNSNELLDTALHATKSVTDRAPGAFRTYLTNLREDKLKEISRDEDGKVYTIQELDHVTAYTDVDISSNGNRRVFVTSFGLVDEYEVVPGTITQWSPEDAFLVEDGSEEVKLLSSGIGASESVYSAAISGDGEFVIFSSGTTLTKVNLQTDQRADLRRTRADLRGLEFKGLGCNSNGKWLGFISKETHLPSAANPLRHDVWLADTETETLTNLTESFNNDSGLDEQTQLTADGRFLIFSSRATDIVPDDTNGVSDVFMYDHQTATFKRISLDSDGAQLDGASDNGSISHDGRYITFSSRATRLAPNDTNETSDVFVKDLSTGEVRLLSTTAGGKTPEAGSDLSKISGDGRYVAFRSYADDIVRDAAAFSADLFHTRNPFTD